MVRSRSNRLAGLDDSQPGELRDVVVEAINASNPDLLAIVDNVYIGLDVIELVGKLIEEPATMVTRADRAGRPVVAVWRRGQDQRYRRVGHLECGVQESKARIVLVTTPCLDVTCEAPPGVETIDGTDAAKPRFRAAYARHGVHMQRESANGDP